jgi:glycosyltransferase involved in cell wall biosynthesis
MQLPLVSVIIPVYNAEKYLQLAIDSVLNQTYSNIELILINDLSTDRSSEICLLNKDPRIKYFQNDRNLGIALTRNTGFSKASGKYIAILDNDDIAMPTRIEQQVNFLEGHPDYGMCGTFYSVIDSDGKQVFKVELPTDPKEIKTFLLFQNCFSHSTTMYTYELGREFPYEEKYDSISEYDLWLKMSKITKLANLPVYSGLYRVHGKNFSIKKADTMFALLKKLEAEILDSLKVDYSPEELHVYSQFLNFNFNFFQHKNNLLVLESFLIRLYKNLKRRDDLTMSIIKNFITRRWVLVCFKSRNFSSIISVRLIKAFSFSYFQYIMKQALDKIQNKHVAFET